jgi:phage shock protein A
VPAPHPPEFRRRAVDLARLGEQRDARAMADQARAYRDEAPAAQYEQAGQRFVAMIPTVELNLENLKTLHGKSVQAAQQAKQAVERNAALLQRHCRGGS